MRLSAHKLVHMIEKGQGVSPDLVLIDESTGDEILMTEEEFIRFFQFVGLAMAGLELAFTVTAKTKTENLEFTVGAETNEANPCENC